MNDFEQPEDTTDTNEPIDLRSRRRSRGVVKGLRAADLADGSYDDVDELDLRDDVDEDELDLRDGHREVHSGDDGDGSEGLSNLFGGPSPDSGDPNRFGRVQAIPKGVPTDTMADDLALQPWTDPPTGKVPMAIKGSDDDNPAEDWGYGSSPRWRDNTTDFEAEDYDDISSLGDEGTRVGQLGKKQSAVDEFLSLDDIEEPVSRSRRRQAEAVADEPVIQHQEVAIEESEGQVRTRGSGVSAGRNLPMAIAVGVALGALAFLLFRAGPLWTMGLVTVILAVAGAEFYESARRAGYRPATLLGIAAIVGLPLSVYWKGMAAFPAVLFLSIVFGLLWYLIGVDGGRTSSNLSITMLGIGYIGVLGSFAAMILRLGNGTNILLCAVIATAAADIGALVVGSNAGRSPLSNASPNKTVEGLLGGLFVAIAAAVLFCSVLFGGIEPFNALLDAVILGAIIGVVAPIGDLAESLLKRDFGVKDMGRILPGHGGVLDRFDGLLFVLPTVYYLVHILDLPLG